MQTTKVTFHVTGFDCPSCAAKVERAVQQLDGVLDVRVNFTAGTITLEFLPERVKLEIVQDIVRELGFGIEAEPPRGQAIFHVAGMDCSDELRVIEAALKAGGGVESVSANCVARTLLVNFDPHRTDTDRLQTAMDKAGFPASLEGEPEKPAESSWLKRHYRELLVAVSGLALGSALGLVGGQWLGWWQVPELGRIDASHVFTLSTLLYALAIVTGGFTIVRSAVKALSLGTFDMNFLMAVAAVGAALIWDWAEGASAMFLFSFALYLESHTMGRARRAIEKLVTLAPAVARVRRGGALVEAPAAEVMPGESVLVRAGEIIPVDGKILCGITDVDQAPVTGEAQPVAKCPGDEVFAGSINFNGVIEVRSTKAPGETTLARILHLVQEAQSTKAPSQQFVDRFARWYTPAVIIGAALVALLPVLLWQQPWQTWFGRALVLLVIACPCALVISTPVSIISALTSAAKRGILIKGGAHLENLGRVRTVVFDKTGTLTSGRLEVTKVAPLMPGPATPSTSEKQSQELLAVAAAVELHSEHLLADAVRRHAEQNGIEAVEGIDVQTLPGRGVRATVDERTCYVGNLGLLDDLKIASPAAQQMVTELQAGGQTVVLVVREREVLGAIALSDRPRLESAYAVRELRRLGVRDVAMLTGDNDQTAQSIGRAVGIDHIHAELLPEEKLEKIQFLTRRDQFTAMVGDGVNDAPALAAATVGIAMGAAGTDAAIETADVALMTDRLDRVPEAVALGRRTVAIIRQNITVALVMKGAFMALAVANVATLWMAVVADVGASLLVIANGLRLLKSNYRELPPELVEPISKRTCCIHSPEECTCPVTDVQ